MMEDVKVMLVCGGGASSGFLASSMRKAAKKKGLMMDIFAKSESEIDNYKNEIDALLIGPHLTYLENEIKGKLEGTSVKMAIIDNTVYGSLNGEKAVENVLTLLEG